LEPRYLLIKLMEDSLAEEKEIWRSAETMIRAHGGSAAAVCAETAERWKQRGDLKAAQLWTRILEAVRKLDAEMPQRQRTSNL
jgi:hypothetical protein